MFKKRESDIKKEYISSMDKIITLNDQTDMERVEESQNTMETQPKEGQITQQIQNKSHCITPAISKYNDISTKEDT